MDWNIIDKEVRRIKVIAHRENELVTVTKNTDSFECIGVGTDAAVFRYIDYPEFAVKIFSDDKLHKIKTESSVYLKLHKSDYYPVYHGEGANYLIISYEKGITLYECLLKGIHIPMKIINDVDNARAYAFDKGLNPRDIHLKNILMHDERAKIVDVSEYMKPGNDRRWEYLKEGYLKNYHLIDGKAIPHWILETVRKWYNQTTSENFKVHDFMKELFLLFPYRGPTAPYYEAVLK